MTITGLTAFAALPAPGFGVALDAKACARFPCEPPAGPLFDGSSGMAGEVAVISETSV